MTVSVFDEDARTVLRESRYDIKLLLIDDAGSVVSEPITVQIECTDEIIDAEKERKANALVKEVCTDNLRRLIFYSNRRDPWPTQLLRKDNVHCPSDASRSYADCRCLGAATVELQAIEQQAAHKACAGMFDRFDFGELIARSYQKTIKEKCVATACGNGGFVATGRR